MMQVNVFARLKQDATLPALIVLRLKHLKSQPRVCLASHRSLCAFGPIHSKCRVVWAASPTYLDVASDRRACRIQQRCGCFSKDPCPIAFGSEVALSYPFAWLVRVSSLGPLPQHLPVAMGQVVIGSFGCTVAIVISPSPYDGVEPLDNIFYLGLLVAVQHLLDLPQVVLYFFFLRLCQECAPKSSDRKAEEIEAFLSMNDVSFCFAQCQAAFSQELNQARRDVFFQDFKGGCDGDKVG